MATPFLSTLLLSLLALPTMGAGGAAPRGDILALKSSLAVEEYETSILRSQDGTFSCGLHRIYTGAFTFSIWYSDSLNKTVVWSANRGRPVSSRRSAVTLRKDGVMVLTDYDAAVVWQTEDSLPNVQYTQLLDTGNLVLKNTSGAVVWQSFDSPTDTFLPAQRITATAKIVSTTQLHVPGHYTFRFSDQSIMSLMYDDTTVSDLYWPDPDYQYYENNRNLYNSTRMGSLDDSGEIFASDFAWHRPLAASDKGYGIKRRLTLDYDGNLRLYSLSNGSDSNRKWTVSWLAVSQPCMIHGLCGPYGICHYSPAPTCSCPPGYAMRNPGNWTRGCKPIVDTIGCRDGEHTVKFLRLPNTDFWGSDQQRINRVSWQHCRNVCLSDCTCKGFQYQEGNGTCYPKNFLFNGRTFPTPTVRTMYIKLLASVNVTNTLIPQSNVLSKERHHLQCDHVSKKTIEPVPDVVCEDFRVEPKWFYFYGFIAAFFVIEVFFFTFAWFFVLRREFRSSQQLVAEEGYRVMTSHFRMYSYRELAKATEKFKHELGWGDSGISYKGTLDDAREVVVKRLDNVTRNRAEFQDELHVIARINHMNLTRIWGFCSERSYRMLVLEYVENGSLANILFSNKMLLEWDKSYGVVLLELVTGTRILDFVVGLEEDVHVVLKKFVKMLSYRLDGEEPLWLAEFVDCRLVGDFNYVQAKELIKIAVSCLKEDRKKRPTMESIVESLLSVEEAEN
ncbi:hypothetical protein ACQ4PT_035510 [Festuca glaucescens]